MTGNDVEHGIANNHDDHGEPDEWQDCCKSPPDTRVQQKTSEYKSSHPANDECKDPEFPSYLGCIHTENVTSMTAKHGLTE
jgi:hypothetical protein